MAKQLQSFKIIINCDSAGAIQSVQENYSCNDSVDADMVKNVGRDITANVTSSDTLDAIVAARKTQIDTDEA